MELVDILNKDVRFSEGMKACMNCGVCTAICPAAEFYPYDPRHIMNIVQDGNSDEIEALLQSNDIWYCGQCMSCKSRCPRHNFPGLVISVLRLESQRQGKFTASEKGRQQYALMKVIGGNILKYGYCVPPYGVSPELHPEQGPIWKYIYENMTDVMEILGANLNGNGVGALRKIDNKTIEEINKIFDITGNLELFESIEKHSAQKAIEMGFNVDEKGISDEYFNHIYTYNSEYVMDQVSEI